MKLLLLPCLLELHCFCYATVNKGLVSSVPMAWRLAGGCCWSDSPWLLKIPAAWPRSWDDSVHMGARAHTGVIQGVRSKAGVGTL